MRAIKRDSGALKRSSSSNQLGCCCDCTAPYGDTLEGIISPPTACACFYTTAPGDKAYAALVILDFLAAWEWTLDGHSSGVGEWSAPPAGSVEVWTSSDGCDSLVLRETVPIYVLIQCQDSNPGFLRADAHIFSSYLPAGAGAPSYLFFIEDIPLDVFTPNTVSCPGPFAYAGNGGITISLPP